MSEIRLLSIGEEEKKERQLSIAERAFKDDEGWDGHRAALNEERFDMAKWNKNAQRAYQRGYESGRFFGRVLMDLVERNCTFSCLVDFLFVFFLTAEHIYTNPRWKKHRGAKSIKQSSQRNLV